MMQLQSNRRPLSLHLNEEVIGGNEEDEEEDEVAKWNWAEMDERPSEELMGRVRLKQSKAEHWHSTFGVSEVRVVLKAVP